MCKKYEIQVFDWDFAFNFNGECKRDLSASVFNST